MRFSGVFIFGDSLVDAGNALALAEWYDNLPSTALPDGAPTAEEGYHDGRFTNGFTLADLIANKFLSLPTEPVFPFGYEDPFFGQPLGSYEDPEGNNLNFAYGGAQVIRGGEYVPDLDGQTDAFRDAVDGAADPDALYLFSFGANDVHDLVPEDEEWVDAATAQTLLAEDADEYVDELLEMVAMGARHLLIVGVPDIGIQPVYNGTPDEAGRRAAATEYAAMLDGMIRDRLEDLTLPAGVEIHYASFGAMQESVIATMVSLYGEEAIYPLEDSSLVFFDHVHPTAQIHALGAAFVLDQINGVAAGDTMPLVAPDYSSNGTISHVGETDAVTIALAAGTTYSFEMRGISSLGGNVTTLADPFLSLRGGGRVLGSNDDGGLGLDAAFSFTATSSGTYTVRLGGVGSMTGDYSFAASITGGAALLSGSVYTVRSASSIVLETAAGVGVDVVRTTVSYVLGADAHVEELRTTSDAGEASINLTGNGYAQTIIGNAGSNTIAGRGGSDTLSGLGGNDIYVVDDLGDRIIERGGEGIDLVRASIDFTLAKNVERLTLTGKAAISGTGNGAANLITGNKAGNELFGLNGSDTIKGGGGADNLHGGVGKDRLTGGAGTDDFYFDTALSSTNIDTILDFVVADDSIYLDLSVFGALSRDGTLAASAFRLGTAAADSNDRIIYDQSTGKLYYDADGSGAGSSVLFAKVTAGTALTNADFIAYMSAAVAARMVEDAEPAAETARADVGRFELAGHVAALENWPQADSLAASLANTHYFDV